eukprot:TRINITY_DN59483_c0_g1_i1.p1 TRINITY_DN59483_c0_g1~~TRINITY_DN59483_c0_g1_i1.p1  ORF type:complete len:117 (-),score=0.12 TRINITY_DN59483_c0_g1_i1:197-547(-)
MKKVHYDTVNLIYRRLLGLKYESYDLGDSFGWKQDYQMANIYIYIFKFFISKSLWSYLRYLLKFVGFWGGLEVIRNMHMTGAFDCMHGFHPAFFFCFSIFFLHEHFNFMRDNLMMY